MAPTVPLTLRGNAPVSRAFLRWAPTPMLQLSANAAYVSSSQSFSEDRRKAALLKPPLRFVQIFDLDHVQYATQDSQRFRSGVREAADEDNSGVCGQAEAPGVTRRFR